MGAARGRREVREDCVWISDTFLTSFGHEDLLPEVAHRELPTHRLEEAAQHDNATASHRWGHCWAQWAWWEIVRTRVLGLARRIAHLEHLPLGCLFAFKTTPPSIDSRPTDVSSLQPILELLPAVPSQPLPHGRSLHVSLASLLQLRVPVRAESLPHIACVRLRRVPRWRHQRHQDTPGYIGSGFKESEKEVLNENGILSGVISKVPNYSDKRPHCQLLRTLLQTIQHVESSLLG